MKKVRTKMHRKRVTRTLSARERVFPEVEYRGQTMPVTGTLFRMFFEGSGRYKVTVQETKEEGIHTHRCSWERDASYAWVKESHGKGMDALLCVDEFEKIFGFKPDIRTTYWKVTIKRK